MQVSEQMVAVTKLAKAGKLTPLELVVAALMVPGVDKLASNELLGQWFNSAGFPCQPDDEQTFCLEDVTKDLF